MFDLYVTDTNLKRGLPHFTLTHIYHSLYFLSLSFFLFFFFFPNEKADTLDSIYQPQLGFARVSKRPHLFPEKTETENRRYHNSDTVCVCLYVHGSIDVLYVTVCADRLCGLFPKSKQSSNLLNLLSYLCS